MCDYFEKKIQIINPLLIARGNSSYCDLHDFFTVTNESITARA